MDPCKKARPDVRGVLSLSKSLAEFAPAGAKKSGSFSAAACTSPKILYVMQVA